MPVVPKAPAPPEVALPVNFGNRSAVPLSLACLLGRIGMALTSRIHLRAIDAERIGGAAAVSVVGEVAVIVEQIRIRGQIVHRRRVPGRLEDRLARWIFRSRVGCEVMIKRLFSSKITTRCLIGVAVRASSCG